MLTLIIPAHELFNDETQEFIYEPERVLQLEHSLISISKWEAKWTKPFLSDRPQDNKTFEEIIDYIKCMTINEGIPDSAYLSLSKEQYAEINKYISAPMTATTIQEPPGKKSREIITSELLYYYMIAYNIPIECEKWHLNRLMTLIKICNIKNQPEKKRSTREIMQSNTALNAARKKKLNTKG